MRAALLCLAASLTLVAACSKAPTNAASAAAPAAAPQAANSAPAAAPAASGATVSGVYTGSGKQATLTEVTAYPDEPFDGKPVTALVFSEKPQAGDDKPATDALFGHFGAAIVARVQADGTVIGADVVHPGLDSPSGSVSLSGVLTIQNYSNAGGQISGRLTSGGDTDLFGHKLNVDLTFHTKAP